MPTILLTNSYSDKPLFILCQLLPQGFDLLTLDKACKEELLNKVASADYLLVSGRVPIDKDVVNAASRLKMIQRTGVGTDTLDLRAIMEKKIPVYINYGVNSQSVAEHTLMLILSVLRRLTYIDTSVRSGKWLKNELGLNNNELYNKTVGLIGFGKIGSRVALLLKAFGANILYTKRNRLSNTEESISGVNYCELHDLLVESDIISLHCPLITETEGIIGRKEMKLMKHSSIIINTARGSLIDEVSLIEFLRSRQIKGAGLDVFNEEPLSANSPLLEMENVILTPHLGGITMESFQRIIGDAMYNINLFDSGKYPLIESKRLQL